MMKVFFSSEKLPALKNVVVTLGVFDGVHRGHQQIFKQVIANAKKIRGTSVVYTFDPHPAKVLVPEACPPMLNTLEQKMELVASTGVDILVVESFTKAYARQTPEAFFKKIILSRFQAKEIVVGYDFTFGVHRSGTLSQLRALAEQHGIQVRVMNPYLWKETIVSSTQIRQRLAAGQMEKAETLLGRPYFMDGKVIHGRGVGGQLGIHTANLSTDNTLILPTGVYVSWTQIIGNKKRYRSVTNIGPNPTFGSGPISIETHLLHFDRSIVNKKIRIEFLKKIREEIAFPSPKELTVQIHHDIEVAQTYFRKQGNP